MSEVEKIRKDYAGELIVHMVALGVERPDDAHDDVEAVQKMLHMLCGEYMALCFIRKVARAQDVSLLDPTDSVHANG